MAATPWHDRDHRVIGWFLVALVVLVVLVGDPRGEDRADDASAAATVSPGRLCGSLDTMATLRDRLVDGDRGVTMDDLREATRHTADLGARTEGLDGQEAEGLGFFLDLFLALPDQPTTQQLLSAGAPASVTDQARADALVGWLDDNCGRPATPAS